jgi:2-polyprenyl-6-methoxyphenol hydroxylase-like FAD-dependent oxidoreductase
MDPITGQGMSQAFRDAEMLADAIKAGLDGTRNLEQALQAYEKERNRQSLPTYKLTNQQAELAPPKPPNLRCCASSCREGKRR